MSFPSLLQRFFTDRLLGQLGASPHTVAAYRDAFRLLLRFAAEHLGRVPSELRLEDLDVSFLRKFLEHLEGERRNCTRTRNNRLSALQSFFRYVAFNEPALALHCQRVLAIPAKRYARGPVEFLTEDETKALVAAPDPGTWIGQAGPGASARCHPDGTAQQRDHLASMPGCGVRHRRSRPLPRKGAQDAVHAATPGRRRGAQEMAIGAGRRSTGSRLPQLSQHAPQCRCPPKARRPSCSRRTSVLPLSHWQDGDAPYPAALGGHGSTPATCGPKRDRSLARPRIDRNDSNLLARRHAA